MGRLRAPPVPMPALAETLLWVALAAGTATLLLVPLLAAWFRRRGIRDEERSLRKIHRGDVPRAGGLAVFAVVLVGVAVASRLGLPLDRTQLAILAAASGVGLVGLADDLVGLKARVKLAVQVLCAVGVVAAGLRWPALEALFERNWFSFTLTVFYFVVAVNAVNLIDGLDGLAGGVVLAAASVVLGGGLLGTTPPEAALVTALAAGATLGFLAHNRPPARVFLGDGGAYFLGFLLAAELLLVDSVRPRKAVVELSVPLLALALPMLDAGLAVLRRMARGQPIFSSDADHVHHRLLARGLGPWGALLVLWGVAGWFAAMALLTVGGVGGSATVAGALAAVLALPVALDYHRGRAGVPGRAAQSWRQRRREVVEALREVDRAAAGVREPVGPERWRACEGPVLRVAEVVGAVRSEVRDGTGRTVVAGGATEGARVFLAIPLCDGAELRFGFPAPSSATLSPEASHTVERLVAVLVDEDGGARRSGETPAVTHEEEDAEAQGDAAAGDGTAVRTAGGGGSVA